jgi:hypothetical protein
MSESERLTIGPEIMNYEFDDKDSVTVSLSLTPGRTRIRGG